MFLSIFGLRGLKHENESETALRCARELYETFSNYEEIQSISVGVTIGKSYCGVVGHALRREYSVISVAVNRAARLMIAYPNTVSCDQETFIDSRINVKNFKMLPFKSLKGISESIVVYEFCGIDDENYNFTNFDEYDILYGREEVLIEMNKHLVNAIIRYNNRQKENRTSVSCFAMRGENGEGRSKIINFMFHYIHKSNIKCLRILPNPKHSSMPFWILKRIFKNSIETEYGNNEDEFKRTITEKFHHLNIHEYLFLFNEIIGTSFDESDVESEMNDEQKFQIQKLLVTILFKSMKNFWVVLIDDADYIDLYSLTFTNSIIESQKIFFILAIGKNHKKLTLQQGKFIKNGHVTQYFLKPIDKTFQKDIACQSINVSAIPVEFERFLHKNSNGNAGWIERCAKKLLYSGKLKIKTLSYYEAVNNGMVMRSELLGNQRDDFFNIESCTQGTRNERMFEVAVIDGTLIEKDCIVEYKNNKLMIYDTLSSYDQMICKCASVIGPSFYRNQLNYLINKIDHRAMGKTIAKLFRLSILFCASTVQSHTNNVDRHCSCKNIEIIEACRNLPLYANCMHMTFNDEMFRIHVYDTLIEKQRIEYHRKCIKFLCRTTRKCSSCNHEMFAILEEIKQNFRDGYPKNDCNVKEKKENVLRNVLPLEKNQCNDLSRELPIVLNYMNYDYRNCKCKFLLNHAFCNIMGHCQGEDMIMKKIFSQITFADISIQDGNIPNAIQILNQTIELLDVSFFLNLLFMNNFL